MTYTARVLEVKSTGPAPWESPLGHDSEPQTDPLCTVCAEPVIDGESSITRTADGIAIVWHIDCAPEEMRITRGVHGGGMSGHDAD